MIPTIFTAADSATARAGAHEYAQTTFPQTDIAPVDHRLTVSEIQQVRDLSVSPLLMPVVNCDAVSDAATQQLLTLVRKGEIVGYSTTIHEASGIYIRRTGLRSDDSVYLACVEGGMTSAEAAQSALMGRGSADAAASALHLMSSRFRVIKLLDAIRAHDLSAVHTAAAAFTAEDVVLVRKAIEEIHTGDWALWAQHEVEIFSEHIDFVTYTLSNYYITSPSATALPLAMGLYYAECGLLS